MNPADIGLLDIPHEGHVRVKSEIGSMIALVRPFDVRQGNVVMYFPEANDLVPRRADEKSKTPAFKRVPVEIEVLQSVY